MTGAAQYRRRAVWDALPWQPSVCLGWRFSEFRFPCQTSGGPHAASRWQKQLANLQKSLNILFSTEQSIRGEVFPFIKMLQAMYCLSGMWPDLPCPFHEYFRATVEPFSNSHELESFEERTLLFLSVRQTHPWWRQTFCLRFPDFLRCRSR